MLFGEIDLNIRNQALLQKEGEGSAHKYTENLICTDICCLPGGDFSGIWGMSGRGMTCPRSRYEKDAWSGETGAEL